MSFKFYVVIVACLAFAGCAPITVKTDYNKSVDFNRYKQYQWIPNEQPGLVETDTDKLMLDETVSNTVERELETNGYVQNNTNPDFLVSYYFVVNAKTDVYFVNNYYTGLGYRAEPGRSSTRDSEKIRNASYEQGILIIDILDSTTKERIWRGYAQSRLNVFTELNKKKQRVATAVKKILARFPP
ncbi:MAG: DUF4136 domain-containing protein [Gammaproteobacteria bacterium]|jgi:hypothetical protein